MYQGYANDSYMAIRLEAGAEWTENQRNRRSAFASDGIAAVLRIFRKTQVEISRDR